MAGFILTFAALVFMLLIIRGLMRRSRLAIGTVVGAVAAVALAPRVDALFSLNHVPIWLPPLPFALIATTLFAFGVLAWFWSED
jgi:uncharacterized membrane protein required for colicin V production